MEPLNTLNTRKYIMNREVIAKVLMIFDEQYERIN